MISQSWTAARKKLFVIFLAAVLAPTVSADDSPLAQVSAGMHDLIYRLSRSVVSVEATRSVSGLLPGFPGQIVQSTASTGLVCDTAGHILVSASSVIGYDQIQIAGEDRSLPGRIVAIDYQNDMALLSTSIPVGHPVAEMTSRGGCVGQMILSLASVGGSRASPSIGFCAGCRTDGLLQFSLAASPSSVGGGIFDMSGKLLGVIIGQPDNPASQTAALPAHKLPEIINYLLEKGTRWAGFAGVATRWTQINPPIELSSGDQRLANFGKAELIDHGVVITAVLNGSPAAKAGIIPGDLIISIDDQQVDSPDDVARIITALTPGTIVAFKVLRHDRFLSVRVLVEARPSQLLAESARSQGTYRRDANSRTTDSLLEVLSRLRDEVSKVEQRLRSID